MTMRRAQSVLPSGTWDRARESGAIALPYDGRHRRRLAMRTGDGCDFLLDLPEAHALRDGDGLLLDDGGVVRVVASAEPVADVLAPPHLLLRLAWHIGNRHIPCELLPDRIRIARDHVLEAMVQGLGARVERVEAPFQPEAGAYAAGNHAHVDGHAHDHGDVHGHAHPHGQPHDHDHPHPHDDGAAHAEHGPAR
jgi:urease accessory protein